MDFSSVEEKIGINFNNKELLTQVFVHRSYLNEHPEFKLDHNERLEFLGDAVLELVVTEYLYKNFPNPEGELTALRAALVNSKMLSRVGFELGLDKHLLLSKGEEKSGQRARLYIVTNTVEALIGAIYLDKGYKKAAEFIHKFIIPHLNEIIEKRLHKDPKSLFQEMAQEKRKTTPRYEVLKEWGPDHARRFLIGVFLGEEKIAEGEGRSKQEAQQEAAKNALVKMGWEN